MSWTENVIKQGVKFFAVTLLPYYNGSGGNSVATAAMQELYLIIDPNF